MYKNYFSTYMSYTHTFTVDTDLSKYLRTWIYGGQKYTLFNSLIFKDAVLLICKWSVIA